MQLWKVSRGHFCLERCMDRGRRWHEVAGKSSPLLESPPLTPGDVGFQTYGEEQRKNMLWRMPQLRCIQGVWRPSSLSSCESPPTYVCPKKRSWRPMPNCMSQVLTLALTLHNSHYWKIAWNPNITFLESRRSSAMGHLLWKRQMQVRKGVQHEKLNRMGDNGLMICYVLIPLSLSDFTGHRTTSTKVHKNLTRNAEIRRDWVAELSTRAVYPAVGSMTMHFSVWLPHGSLVELIPQILSIRCLLFVYWFVEVWGLEQLARIQTRADDSTSDSFRGRSCLA